MAERREALSHWRVQRCQLRDRRKWFISHSNWGHFQEESTPPIGNEKELADLKESMKFEEVEGKTNKVKKMMRKEMVEPREGKEKVLINESAKLSIPEEEKEQKKIGEEAISPGDVKDGTLPSPASDLLHGSKDSSHSAFSMHSQYAHPGVGILKDCSPSDFLLVSYPGQTAEAKESPNQEVSSVSEMTASLMSTSSDFVDTPYDENLPDFDVDPRRPSSSDTYPEAKISPAYTKSSIEFILYDRSEDVHFTRHRGQTTQLPASALKTEASVNKSRVLEEEYGIQSQTTEGGKGRLMRASEDNLNVVKKSVSEAIREKVLLEEYGITVSRKAVQNEQDNNANFADGNNGNGNDGNANAINKDNGNGNSSTIGNMTSDINANVPSVTSPIVTETIISMSNPSICDSKNLNTSVDTIISSVPNDTNIKEGKNNENPRTPNMNELVIQFKERRAQAAATREKVMNEEFQTTNKNIMNICRSRYEYRMRKVYYTVFYTQ